MPSPAMQSHETHVNIKYTMESKTDACAFYGTRRVYRYYDKSIGNNLGGIRYNNLLLLISSFTVKQVYARVMIIIEISVERLTYGQNAGTTIVNASWMCSINLVLLALLGTMIKRANTGVSAGQTKRL